MPHDRQDVNYIALDSIQHQTPNRPRITVSYRATDTAADSTAPLNRAV